MQSHILTLLSHLPVINGVGGSGWEIFERVPRESIKCLPHKTVKHTCLSVFGYFMELALKRVNAGVLKAPFLVLRFSYYTWLTFLILVSAILLYIRVILLFKCDWASDLWQQLELDFELESDPWDILDWGRKWLVDFDAEKI